MSHATPVPKPARAWSEAVALSLSRVVGKHKHPTEPGFLLRVSPKLKAVYAYRFKDSQGAEVSETLGEVRDENNPDGWALDAALAEYQVQRAKARTRGPRLTLAAASETWLANSPNRRTDGVRSPRTVEYYREAYTRYLSAHADANLADANTDYWMAALRDAKERAPHQARGAFWLLHAIYAYHVELKVLADNPCASSLMRRTFSGKNLKTRRTTVLALADAPVFFAGVLALPRHSRDAALLIALTGWRHLAALGMEWKHVDFARGCYTVRPQAVGWKGFVGEIALADAVLDLLRERRALLAGEEYVFPARHGKSAHMVDVGGGLAAASAKLGARVGANDLRRAWNTVAEAVLDGNALLIARLDGHAASATAFTDVQAGYLVGDLQAQRVSAQRVAEAVLETGGVLPLSVEVQAVFERRGMRLAPALKAL